MLLRVRFFYNWYPLFVFLLGTGCRIGEVIGIRWDDVDLEKRIININHSLTYYPRADDNYRCEFRVSEPKTQSGIRNIPMIMGHADVSTTMNIYAEVNENVTRASLENLARNLDVF